MQANPEPLNLTKPSDYKIFIFLALVLGCCLASNSFIRASLWLDECISYWVSSSGSTVAISRSWNFQGQSPLYYVLLSGWIKLTGNSEIALRSFSLICLCISTFVIFSWIKKIISAQAAFTASVIFICQDATLLALSARPYALGILFCILANISLFNFLKNKTSLLYYIIFGTLAIYSHYFAAPGICAAAFILSIFGKLTAEQRKKLFASLLLISIFCLPLIPQIQLLQNKSAEIAFAPPLSLDQIGESIFPAFPMLAILIACVACATYLRVPIQKIFSSSKSNQTLLLLAGSWWLVPSLLFLILSAVSGSSFLLPRYLSFSTPAFAILAAYGLAKIQINLQRIIIIMIVVLLGLREINRSWAIEEWRSAINFVSDKQTQLLFASGLAEANQINWLENTSSDTQQYLLAPLQVYGKELPAKAIPTLLEKAALKNFFVSKLKEASSTKSQGITIIFSNSGDFLKNAERVLSELGLTKKLIKSGQVGLLEIS